MNHPTNSDFNLAEIQAVVDQGVFVAEDDPYAWAPPNDRTIVDAFQALGDEVQVGFDGFGAPIYAHQIEDPIAYLANDPRAAYVFPMRFVAGLDQDLDISEFRNTILWQVPTETKFGHLEHFFGRSAWEELLNEMFGRPLCEHELDSRGTE